MCNACGTGPEAWCSSPERHACDPRPHTTLTAHAAIRLLERRINEARAVNAAPLTDPAIDEAIDRLWDCVLRGH